MSDVNVQIQNPQQTVNINNPSIVIEVAEQSIEVEFSEQNIEIQVQSPVIEVNIGGPCDCGDGGGGTWGSITGTLSDQTDLQTALDGKAASSHTHPLADITDAGALAALSAVDTAEITNDAVTNEKAANMAAWTVKCRNNAASGDPQDIGVADLTEKGTPAAGDMLFGWESGGTLRKFDIGNLPGGGASYTEITYAAMQTAITNATLTPGGWYLITDAAGTDLGFLTYAVTENSISVAGVGGYLNADFQAVGNYDGVEAIVGIAAGTQQGIWRTGFEALTISYTNLTSSYVEYTSSSGLLSAGEPYTVPATPAYIYYFDATGPFTVGETITGNENGSTAIVIADDGVETLTVDSVSGDWDTEATFSGDVSLNSASFDAYDPAVPAKTGTATFDTGSVVYIVPNEALLAGDVITGDNSGNTVTVDAYIVGSNTFAVGETITGATSGGTAVIVTDDGSGSMTAYMTSAGIALDGSEVLDNGAGVVANMSGAATGPTIQPGDIVIWNLLHWQLTDDTLLNGTNPATNTAAYTQLLKTDADQGYITAWDISEFDVTNNHLQYRADARGNEYRYTKADNDFFESFGVNMITRFQFGSNNVEVNKISNSAVDIYNSLGQFKQNIISGRSTVDIDMGIGSIFSENYILLSSITQTNLSQQNRITRNRVEISSFLGIAFSGVNSGIQENVLFTATFNTMDISGNCSVKKNTLSSGAEISDIICADLTTIANNILENGASLTGITAGANCSISRNKVGQGATLGGGTTMGDTSFMNDNILYSSARIETMTIGDGCYVQNNILESDGRIKEITMGDGCSVLRNKIGAEAILGVGTTMGAGAEMNDLEIRANKSIANKELDAAVTFSDKVIQVTADGAETLSANVDGNRSVPGFSDIPATIDITGLTTLDCTAAFAQYRGIYNLTSSNATENIDTITNPPTAFPFLLRPAAGLVLTVTGTAYAGIAAGQIALKAASYALDGDKGEYIVLEIDPLGTGALIEKQVVNGLI